MVKMESISENAAALAAIDQDYTEDELELWEEILDYAIWEFCFDVHRTVKLNYLHLDPALDPDVYPEERKFPARTETLKEKKCKSKAHDNTVVECPNCYQPTTAVGIGTHLPRCMGLAGRSNAREANKKRIDETEENEFENSPCSSSSSSSRSRARKSKKRRNKKVQKTKAEAEYSPTTSSEMNGDLETFEEGEAFFNGECDDMTETNESRITSYLCTKQTNEESRELDESSCYSLLSEFNADSSDSRQINADSPENGEINADSPDNADTPDSGDVNAVSPDSGDVNADSPDSGDVNAVSPDSLEINADTPDSGETIADTPDSGETIADTPDSGETIADTPDSPEINADFPDSGEINADTPDNDVINADTPDNGETNADTEISGESNDDNASKDSSGFFAT